MKSLHACASALLLAASFGFAQPSPPATASVTIQGKTISIKYSAPSVKGREGKIFNSGGLISRDQTYPVWRAGANSATTLHTDANLDIAGLAVPAGDHTLFINIQDPNAWELVVNKQTGQWGLSYDKAQDLGRVKMNMSKPPAMVETMKYTLTDLGGNRGKLELAWENHAASVDFTVK